MALTCRNGGWRRDACRRLVALAHEGGGGVEALLLFVNPQQDRAGPGQGEGAHRPAIADQRQGVGATHCAENRGDLVRIGDRDIDAFAAVAGHQMGVAELQQLGVIGLQDPVVLARDRVVHAQGDASDCVARAGAALEVQHRHALGVLRREADGGAVARVVAPRHPALDRLVALGGSGGSGDQQGQDEQRAHRGGSGNEGPSMPIPAACGVAVRRIHSRRRRPRTAWTTRTTRPSSRR
jgi:hypothetical protein